MTSAAAEPGAISVPVVLVLLIIGGTIYTFGYARAVLARAKGDYIKTRDAVPGLRKDFWRSLWKVVKVGFWVVVVFAVLLIWMIQDVRGD